MGNPAEVTLDDVARRIDELTRSLERLAAAQGGGNGNGGGNAGPPQGTGGGDDWVDQSASPMGSRLHCAAVRRRRAEGKGGAAIKNRRHLLTREALAEEMMHSPKPGLRKAGPRGVPAQAPERKGSVAESAKARIRLLRSKKPE